MQILSSSAILSSVTHQVHPLADIYKNALMSKNLSTVFFFDLDSTIFDVTPRHVHILRKFSSQWFRLPPRWKKAIANDRALELRNLWGPTNVLKALGFTELSEREVATINKYWSKEFFSNRNMIYDVPHSYAIEYVKALHQCGVEIAYLTGRPQHMMKDGTVEQLKRHGLPNAQSENHLFMKHVGEIDDSEFKVQFLARYAKRFPDKEIFFMDNEPVILNSTLKHVSGITPIHFASVDSGRADPDAVLTSVKGFPNLSGKQNK